jgi:two-component system, sensor histidine kinase and response regulator
MKSLFLMIERRTMAVKLTLVVSILFIVTICVTAVSTRSQLALSEQLTQTFELDLLGVSNLKDAQFAYAVMGRSIRQAIIAQDAGQRELALKQLADAQTNLYKEIDEGRARFFREDGVREFNSFITALVPYQKNIDMAKEMLKNEQIASATVFVASPEFGLTGQAASEAISAAVVGKESRARASALQAQVSAAANVRQIYALLAGGLLLAFFMAWLVVRSIRQPFAQVSEAVDRVASGQLDAQIPHSDFSNELGGLVRSVQVLQTAAQKIEAEGWLKSNLTQISSALQTTKSFAELSQVLFSKMAPLI